MNKNHNHPQRPCPLKPQIKINLFLSIVCLVFGYSNEKDGKSRHQTYTLGVFDNDNADSIKANDRKMGNLMQKLLVWFPGSIPERRCKCLKSQRVTLFLSPITTFHLTEAMKRSSQQTSRGSAVRTTWQMCIFHWEAHLSRREREWS